MPIIFFDMDKTLTPEISAVFLGTQLGKEAEVLELEELVGSKKISDEKFIVDLGQLARGYSVQQLREFYEKMPLIPGIADTMKAIKEKKFKSAIITSGVGLFSQFLCEDYGFDRYYANTTLMQGSLIQGFSAPYIGRNEKPDFVYQFCNQEQIEPKACFAVGDSPSDIPMFRSVGTSIAINCPELLREEATYYINPCTRLTQILEFL
ncbi:MAG: HAD-IB family phosphatase [archaeon]